MSALDRFYCTFNLKNFGCTDCYSFRDAIAKEVDGTITRSLDAINLQSNFQGNAFYLARVIFEKTFALLGRAGYVRSKVWFGEFV